MNIIEAVRSGKPCRRKAWAPGCVQSPFRPSENSYYSRDLELSACDILADDWEIEERKVEITYSVLERAIEKSHYPFSWREKGVPICPTQRLAKELGLID